ncbi:hypothetical protein K402DRAFT_236166 [Aulographum hederae CBS 113979]|uniref:Uncharacterized protein n=1 Tax=Aulographum hederae CBS 113979 TaxID=1176131 RepID=A0A6G1GKT9_9PEZI|nr:hypothetical protein K402DRAFT_236166 [Aulographum hederae CBS 113979]
MDVARASIIYQLLPMIIQQRIRALPSLRQSLVEKGGPPLHSRSISDVSGMQTPPPEYSSRNCSGIMSPAEQVIEDSRDAFFPRSSPESSSSSTAGPFEEDAEVDWKYATQGTGPPLDQTSLINR